MGVIVSFDPVAFVQRYPEFAGVNPDLLQLYFNEATLYVRNDGGGPVNDPAVQSMLLNMVTAHICQLNAPASMMIGGAGAAAAAGLVGRISAHTEGSVSVNTELQLPPGIPQIWAQTKYGIAFWLASAPYRMMRYYPGRERVFDPWQGLPH